MKKPVINVVDAPTHTGAHGTHFRYSMTELAGALGARSIGANITRVPPGKAAFPFRHRALREGSAREFLQHPVESIVFVDEERMARVLEDLHARTPPPPSGTRHNV